MINRRNSLPHSEAVKKSAVIENILFKQQEFINANKIFIYHSIKNEVDTLDLIEKSISIGKTVALPVVKSGNEMDFFKTESLSSLKKGSLNIPEPPKNSERLLPDNNTLIITPGTVFGKDKNRIGMGKGYYDRYFKKYATTGFKKIGLCYDFQIVDSLPSEAHDVPLNKIISEKGVIE